MKTTMDEAQELLREVESHAYLDDHEAAHDTERKLFAMVLKEIADGAPNPRELAAVCVESMGVKFFRWTA